VSAQVVVRAESRPGVYCSFFLQAAGMGASSLLILSCIALSDLSTSS